MYQSMFLPYSNLCDFCYLTFRAVMFTSDPERVPPGGGGVMGDRPGCKPAALGASSHHPRYTWLPGEQEGV